MSDQPHDIGEPPDGFSRRQRRLPHWENPGATYFLRFSLPDSAVCDLSDARLAPIIIGALRFFAGQRYLLFEYSVMPDHVHVLLKPLQRDDGTWEPLGRITHSIKSWTANQINGLLGRRGTLWQDETYDHAVRSEDDRRECAWYIWMNPVNEGLVRHPLEWPWSGNGQWSEEVLESPRQEQRSARMQS